MEWLNERIDLVSIHDCETEFKKLSKEKQECLNHLGRLHRIPYLRCAVVSRRQAERMATK